MRELGPIRFADWVSPVPAHTREVLSHAPANGEPDKCVNILFVPGARRQGVWRGFRPGRGAGVGRSAEVRDGAGVGRGAEALHGAEVRHGAEAGHSAEASRAQVGRGAEVGMGRGAGVGHGAEASTGAEAGTGGGVGRGARVERGAEAGSGAEAGPGVGAAAFAECWLPHVAGRGYSGHVLTPRARGDLRAQVHDVMQVVASLPRRVVLVGHGGGARVVAYVLGRYPALAGVLISPLVRDRRLPRPVGNPPVLVAGSPDDRVVSRKALDRVAGLYGSAPLLFPGMGHDLMRGPDWAEPIDAVLDWLEKESVVR